MNYERRVKHLEKKLGANNELRLIIYRQILESLDDKTILDKHTAEAKDYINTHPQLWEMSDPGNQLKVITVLANRNGWNIEGHTQA